MCKSAAGKAPSPHSSIMKPICAMVECASDALTDVCVSMTTDPNNAVNPPTRTSTSSAGVERPTMCAKRSTRKPPALMMPACNIAETGVGVSITSTSQPCSGNCADFSSAVSTSSSVAACMLSGTALAARIASAPAKTTA